MRERQGQTNGMMTYEILRSHPRNASLKHAFHLQPCTSETRPARIQHGELPQDLPGGAYLRVGPNPKHPTGAFFDGDGMVHVVTLPPAGASHIQLHSSLLYAL